MDNVGNQLLAELFASLGLNVDGEAIAATARQRGFKGAQLVAIAVATAAFVETGEDVGRAIDHAIEVLESRVRDLERARRRQ